MKMKPKKMSKGNYLFKNIYITKTLPLEILAEGSIYAIVFEWKSGHSFGKLLKYLAKFKFKMFYFYINLIIKIMKITFKLL